ncbi:sigma-54-dependent Fis family transcriptional regulator [Pseudomonas xanthosomatis]|uniref:sigma-54-dependent Fis family transcriptional regulator n=1 Tax=Pseudomonas xanthosomatis TaxID=2842356 RepID=UPI001C3D6F23|nr:sigma-54-dependent Fis family transcriptional regulator [Pseudomonas xanthosomatis]QXH44814.1 sigma-54-dependent Fis family transcriptional regulator [Pseudomonas xanthosomatis]
MSAPVAPPRPSDLAAIIDCHFANRGLTPEPVIAQSWYRSITQHNLDPAQRHVDNLLSASEVRQHQARHEAWLNLAGQGLNGLAQRVAPAGFAVLLSDRNGITLDARLPIDTQRYTRAGLMAGACWDESIAGTNGIGTALAAGVALTIHRQEHFLSSNARLSCSVAPLFDAQNQLLGCLNATSLHDEGPKQAQHLTLQLVSLYARMIEDAHFRQHYRDRLTLALNPEGQAGDLAARQLLALDESGRVIGANRAAFLNHPQALLGQRIDQLLPADIDQLLELTRGGARGVTLREHAEQQPLDIGLRVPAGYRPRSLPAGKRANSPHPGLDNLAGEDPHLQQAVSRLRKVLNKDIAILLGGETGTGKEAFARALHQASQRHAGPFVALNCAAIPESLIESELFGYRGGSFTGANRKGMKGKLELADGGTLFLDEIGDMPAHLQTRLLRVLAERELLPLGAEVPVALDIQVISATHQDLAALIASKGFREDLYYRLSGMRVQLPALRERSDRGMLIERLLAGLPGAAGLRLDDQARRCLLSHPWPGNIRQLLNVLRYAVALAEGGVIGLDCLPEEMLASPAPPPLLERQVEAAEARHLLELLQRQRWNMSAAAEVAGISRSTLYRKMKLYGIVQPNQR